MTINKDTSTPALDPNGTVIYTIEVANSGDQDLTNFQVTDALPDFNGGTAGNGYTITSVTATGFTVNFPGFDGLTDTNLLAGTDTLPNNTTATIEITLDIADAVAGTYDNTAVATTDQTGSIDDDGTTANDAGTPSGGDPENDEDVTVLNPPTITKAFSVTDLAAGGNTDLTVTIGNANAGAITLTSALTDTFPAGMTINTVGNTGTCTGVTATAGAGNFTIANGTSIPAGGCTVIVNVTSTTAGVATNTIPAGDLQTTAGNNPTPATDTLNVYTPPTVTKAFNPTTIASSGTSVMTLTVTNPAANPGPLTGIQLPDTFPAGMTLANMAFTFTPAACGTVTNTTGGASVTGDNNVRLNVATLAAGASCTVDVNVTSSTAGAALNTTGNVTATGPVVLTGGTANDTLTVSGQPDLIVTKTNDTTGTIAQGSTFNWTIAVTNNGTANAVFTAGQTFLSDPLPVNANYGLILIGGGIFGDFNCSIALGTLACTVNSGGVVFLPGDSISVTFAVTPTAGGSLVNTATVDPDGNVTESDEGNNTGSDTVAVVAPPSISKSFSPNPVLAGVSSTLTLTITNPNTGTALTGVAFTDTYPAGLVNTTPASTSNTCGGTLTATDGSGSVSLTDGTIAAGGSCTITTTVVAAVGGDYGNQTGNVTSTNGGTGNSASSTLHVFDAQPSKSIVTTSEPSTGFVSTAERVTIGEMVRYRLATRIPEGSYTNVQLLDGIPNGLQFLDDGTATVAFVCNSGAACMTSSTLAGAGLVVNGSSSSVSPTFAVPGSAISGGPFGSDTDVTFSFGDITNVDADFRF